ncbi:hypothetical protein [Halalkalicoccus salilacus]
MTIPIRSASVRHYGLPSGCSKPSPERESTTFVRIVGTSPVGGSPI